MPFGSSRLPMLGRVSHRVGLGPAGQHELDPGGREGKGGCGRRRTSKMAQPGVLAAGSTSALTLNIHVYQWPGRHACTRAPAWARRARPRESVCASPGIGGAGRSPQSTTARPAARTARTRRRRRPCSSDTCCGRRGGARDAVVDSRGIVAQGPLALFEYHGRGSIRMCVWPAGAGAPVPRVAHCNRHILAHAALQLGVADGTVVLGRQPRGRLLNIALREDVELRVGVRVAREGRALAAVKKRRHAARQRKARDIGDIDGGVGLLERRGLRLPVEAAQVHAARDDHVLALIRRDGQPAVAVVELDRLRQI
eukprot:6007414-Prymnesium_polylepis.1